MSAMFLKLPSLLLAAGFMAASLSTAMAQSNNPAGNMGSNGSVTASPGTANSQAASGMHTGDVGAHSPTAGNYSGATPGATGKTVVQGSTSSQAGAAGGTVEQRQGQTAGGGK
jgi:hypothetical protein